MYEDPVQCDKYYDCVDGEATEKLCPDGLVFDAGIRKINKCDQPFSVDCGDRLELRKNSQNFHPSYYHDNNFTTSTKKQYLMIMVQFSQKMG